MDMRSYLKLRGYLQLILFGKGNINFLQWHFNGNNNASGQVFWTTQNEPPGAFIDFYFAFFACLVILIFCLFILISILRFRVVAALFLFACLL